MQPKKSIKIITKPKHPQNEKYIEIHSFSEKHIEQGIPKYIKNNPQEIEKRIKLQLKKLFSIYGSDINKLLQEKKIQDLITKLTSKEKLFFFDTIIKSYSLKEYHNETYNEWYKKILQILDTSVKMEKKNRKLKQLHNQFKETPEKAITKLKQLVSNRYARTEHIKDLQKLDKMLLVNLSKKNEFYILEMIYLFGIDSEVVNAITKTFIKHQNPTGYE